VPQKSLSIEPTMPTMLRELFSLAVSSEMVPGEKYSTLYSSHFDLQCGYSNRASRNKTDQPATPIENKR